MKRVLTTILLGCLSAFTTQSAVAQKKDQEPTPEQLKAAQEGFAKLGGKYDYVLDLRTLVAQHSFKLPRLVKDLPIKNLPDVPFDFILGLDQNFLNADGVKELKKYEKLRRLGYANSLVSADILKALADIPSLQYLDISGATADLGGRKLDEHQIKALAAFKQLSTLKLNFVEITEAGMKRLKDITNLTELHLMAGRYLPRNDQSVLRPLKDVKSLRTLALDDAIDETFRVLKDAKQLRTLKLRLKGPLAKVGIKELRELDQLTSIEMTIYPCTDEDLKELRGLKNLTSLTFTGLETAITDEGMKDLKEHQSLSRLLLTGSNVTDAGMKELSQVKSLTTLRLSCRKVTENALADLKQLPNLAIFHLSNINPSEKAMQDIGAMKKLRYLYVRVPDSGVKHLKDLPDLTSLVCSFGLTDKGMPELIEIRSLRYLNVFYCHGNSVFNVTSKGFNAFQGARPDCLITRARPQELGFELDDR